MKTRHKLHPRVISWHFSQSHLDSQKCMLILSSFNMQTHHSPFRLIIGQQHGCLPYVIALVATLSVGDPFIKEQFLHNVADEDDDDDDASSDQHEESNAIQVAEAEANILDNASQQEKARRRILRKRFFEAQRVS
jgi:HrpA-like RNA helicase